MAAIEKRRSTRLWSLRHRVAGAACPPRLAVAGAHRAAYALAALAFGAALLSEASPAASAGISTLNFSYQALSDPQPAGAVNLNQVRLLTIRGKGWKSVAAAKNAAQVLQAAAVAGISPDAVSAVRAHGGYAIMVAGRRALLVDAAMAAAMNSTRDALAAQWAQRIRAAFAAPYLSLPVDSQVVPVGERRLVPLRGNWQQLRLVCDPQIVAAQHDPAARTLSLLGVAPGETEVLIDAGGASLLLRVHVMKYAGRVAAVAQAAVTGRSAPAWVIKRAASAAVYYSIQAEPGAWAEITEISCDKPSLVPGQSALVTMRVVVAGSGYLPVRAAPRVTVVNEAVAPMEAKVLMVSNRPERIPSFGLWYEGRVPAGYPARLLYHHVNATSSDGELAVELLNAASEAVRVQIIEASGGPSRDEVFAGHRAARDFLVRQHDDVGYIVSIPGGSTYTASAQLLRPGDVISGLAEVRVLGDGDLRLRVRLRPPNRDLVTPAAEIPPERISTWVFSEPQKQLSATYRVGQQWAFATIGDKQVLSSSGRELLDGDYGVFYHVVFDVENPTDGPAEVELAFMPGGGVARGVVLIGGQVYETRVLRYGETQRLYSFTVPPGARRQLRVRTMPQAGSNYPVKLLLRPKGTWD